MLNEWMNLLFCFGTFRRSQGKCCLKYLMEMSLTYVFQSIFPGWMSCMCVCVYVYTCIELRTLELICISGGIYIATKILAYNRRLYDSSFSQILWQILFLSVSLINCKFCLCHGLSILWSYKTFCRNSKQWL